MKKLIIICLLALTYTSTYAQEPTKQETMDWIASKFRDNLNRSEDDQISGKGSNYMTWERMTYKFKSYSLGVIVLEKNVNISLNEKQRNITYTITINLNGLNNVGAYSNALKLYFKENSFFEDDGDTKKTLEFFTVYRNWDCDGCSVGPGREGNYSFLNWESEPDLYNRFIKALNVLVNHNAPKQKF